MQKSKENGRFYATHRRCSMSANFDEETAKLMVGTHITGSIIRNNTVMKHITVSKGGIAGTVVNPKTLFKHALYPIASVSFVVRIILLSIIKSSNCDIEIAKKLIAAGKHLDIIDQIIVSSQGYCNRLQQLPVNHHPLSLDGFEIVL